MDAASIPGFAGLTAGLTVFFLLYAIYSPVRPRKQRTVAEDVFGETSGTNSALDDAAGRYARPLLDNFMPSLPENVVPEKTARKYQDLLRVSGNPLKINPEELFVLQIAMAIIGFVIGLFVAAAAGTNLPQVPIIIYPLIFTVLAGILPYGYHTSLRDKRARDIQRNLPEALDLLQVVIAAGSTFQPALRKVTSQLPESFLREEFTRMHVELQAGASLDHCMKSFANSNTSEEAAAFTSAIIQTQKLGADVTDTLVRQAQLARANHEARIERMIARLQTMLFVPISAFMMPAFLVIFLAPALNNISTQLG
jgi:pilus assembly protein TadC